MAQQQFLLILLGVIIIGIAVVIGISIFNDNAVSENRDSVSTDLVSLAVRAQTYFRRPRTFGGGGNSFVGLTIDKLSSKPSNANGTYSVTSTNASQAVLDGIGIELGSDGHRISVTLTVFPDSLALIPFEAIFLASINLFRVILPSTPIEIRCG